ncbi:MAG: site-specific DNA-methyltransferase [SAR324 cluster bacterium]|nr:site-specific DNA-methyltransferase [SAR324 cluster bacterium]
MVQKISKAKASRNKTISLNDEEKQQYRQKLKTFHAPAEKQEILNSTICQNVMELWDLLPEHSFQLVIADPPYNLNKQFNQTSFSKMTSADYELWLDSWISKIPRLVTSNASIYVCGDWRSSSAIQRVLERYFIVRNRITWEREKGRGARQNWKNNSEDIWFATMSDSYVFNVEAVKLKRRVLAPYKDDSGQPKDWVDSDQGRFRETYPSNLWNDLTIPFWSMPENTIHPTQKPEKLIARLILASSREDDLVFDPFAGSGTTGVVARKLKRNFTQIEIDELYACLAMKRLEMIQANPQIQGFHNGFFWERNTPEIFKKNMETIPT